MKIMLPETVLFSLVLVMTSAVTPRRNDYETPEYLRQSVKKQLLEATQVEHNYGIAKNLVLAIGDGMGISTLTAARIYIGQKRGETGEENKLEFEKFPHVGISKTYNLDRQVPDSAGTAVAMLTGVKVNLGTLGVDGRVQRDNCAQMTEDTKLKNILDHAREKGKSIGIVTTTRITHATPAAAYAHTPQRFSENDAKMKSEMKSAVGCENLKDIAYQLIMENRNRDINVILGGGRRNFLNKTTGTGNRREDGLDLIEEWKKDKSSRKLRHQYVKNKGELMSADTDYLFGLFNSDHMEYEAEKNGTDDGEPSLNDMTKKAIQILSKNPNGFFLLLEGGRIDHGHHNNWGKKALEETEMFDKAVKTVVDSTSDDDTLITVTADHSHTFTIGGYPTRGNNILGTMDDPDGLGWGITDDGLPMLTLGYQNGLSGRVNGSRLNYTEIDTTTLDFQQPADVKNGYESHGGEDVAIFAKGPMSHLFHTSHEQSYIAHVMMYAACIGDYKEDKDCDKINRLRRQAEGGRFVRDAGLSQQPITWLLFVSICIHCFNFLPFKFMS